MNSPLIILLLLVSGLLTASLPVNAHQLSDSYLRISASNETPTYKARWHLGLKDLEMAVGLDNDYNGEITWGEVLNQEQAIMQYAQSSLDIQQQQTACPLEFIPIAMDKLNSGIFIALDFTIICTNDTPLTVTYTPLFELDQSHRGIITYTDSTGEQVSVVGPDNTILLLNTQKNTALITFFQFIKQGIWHIWIGFDHILFLLALLLPSVLQRKNNNWKAHSNVKPVLSDVISIVTTFTIAHSITLIAATLQWINLPIDLVEIIIALSVSIAGLHMLFPIAHQRRWLFAFIFGLIHGFGFASVLSDLELPSQAFWTSIVGFNLGVEIGQLVIVSILLPIIYGVRKTNGYQQWLMPASASLMIIIGTLWTVERSFSIT